MAIFPLGTVLLPGGVLPLHVFEPRYQQMVRDLLGADGPPEFGQVLITHGLETGGGDQRADVGTVARVVDINALPGGRYALAVVGVRRIRVVRWHADDPYPLAEVEDWPEEGEPAPDHRAVFDAAIARVQDLRALAAEVGDLPGTVLGGREPIDVATDPLLAVYQLAVLSPLGEADRYRILTAPGPSERLRVLHEALNDVEAMLRFRLA